MADQDLGVRSRTASDAKSDVSRSSEGNFAARLLSRLSDASDLVDAATGEVVSATELPDRIAGFAAGFSSAGLKPGDRVVIGCKLNPASALAYLGAVYAGLTAVPVDEQGLSKTGEGVFAKSGARAVWTGGGSRCDWIRGAGVLHLEGVFERQHACTVTPAARHEDDLAALM